MTALSRQGTAIFLPMAAVRTRPLHERQVAASGCAAECALIPRAAVCARPGQNRQGSASSSCGACLVVPRGAVCSRPLEHSQMPASSCLTTRVLIPRAALRAHPRQLHQPALCCEPGAQLLTHRHSARGSPLQLAHRGENAAHPRNRSLPAITLPLGRNRRTQLAAAQRGCHLAVGIERARHQREQLGREVVERRPGRSCVGYATRTRKRTAECVEARTDTAQPCVDLGALLCH
mmetsp:Transcript_28351/g.69930  ORF Transcript_28351/g.69930 Transcript_28351/m.69930 type:complete len:234 (+) Transcript_28351:783-1484(+)